MGGVGRPIVPRMPLNQLVWSNVLLFSSLLIATLNMSSSRPKATTIFPSAAARLSAPQSPVDLRRIH